MVENKCSICKKQVEYTITVNTSDSQTENGCLVRLPQNWCLKCLWNKLPTIAGPEEIPKEGTKRQPIPTYKYRKTDKANNELENCAFGAVTSGVYKRMADTEL